MAPVALLLASLAAASTGTVTLAAVGDIRLDGPIAAVAKAGGVDAPVAA